MKKLISILILFFIIGLLYKTYNNSFDSLERTSETINKSINDNFFICYLNAFDKSCIYMDDTIIVNSVWTEST